LTSYKSDAADSQPTSVQIPELLAPGGDWQALQAAVHNGADAVYFGLERFSARSAAQNLSTEQLPSVMRFLHEHSARGYLALNTLMRNEELDPALELARQAYAAGIDAVIVQDIGLLTALHQEMPDLPLHASTQMTLSGGSDLQVARKLGLTRIVLPRELDGAALARITRDAAEQGLETEAFVHGALCICQSGQCLMSSLIGGRSGNRGACAQPCRLDYKLGHGRGQGLSRTNGALLSPRDQTLLSHLPEIVQTSLTSLKIEGRMRGASYVGQTVAVYRQALDELTWMLAEGLNPAEIEAAWPSRIEKASDRLRQAFNRGGDFTSAYWQGQDFRPLMVEGMAGSHGVLLGPVASIEPGQGILRIATQQAVQPGDLLAIRRGQATGPETMLASAPIGSSQAVAGQLQVKGFHPDALRDLRPGDFVYRMSDHAAEQQVLQADRRKTQIEIRLEPDCLKVQVLTGPFAGRSTTVSWQAEPERQPLRKERIVEQLAKTGGTAYQVKEIVAPDFAALSIGQLNGLRRTALSQLSDLLQGARLPKDATNDDRSTAKPRPDDSSRPSGPLNPFPARSVAAFFHRLPADETEIACGADLYELPLLALDEARVNRIVLALHAVEPAARIVLHWPPLVTGQMAAAWQDLLRSSGQWPVDGILAAWPADHDPNPGPRRLWLTDSTANLFNSQSLTVAANFGADTLSPSLELNGDQLIDALMPLQGFDNLTIERPIYGRIRLMSTAYCPIGQNVPGCRLCVRSDAPDDSRLYPLTDRRSQVFQILPHPRTCQADLLNSDLLALPEEWILVRDRLTAANRDWPFNWRSRLYFCDETGPERRQLVENTRQLLQAQGAESTRYAAAAFEATARALAGRLQCRLTNGHFQRGVT
jgi:putative protease